MESTIPDHSPSGPLDHGACYEAIRRRDARFDGRFYTGVTSTGIFCRPSCPARTPRSSNVRFFTHAAAASDAGFRPCRRCRPELAPGHPEWNRRADLAGKALALIEQGVVDRDGVSGLASQLGVSERHLRRELNEAVGTGPTQLAKTRRLWLARLLLDQTNLAITDVAFASGFNSIRQFNDAFRQTFAATPTDLRRRSDTAASGATELTMTLPSRGPAQFSDLHRFLTARAVVGLEHASDGRFRRGVEGGWVELAGTADDDGLIVRCSLDRLDRVAGAISIARRIADLDTDLAPIADHLRNDDELSARLDLRPLPRLPGAFDPFELAIRAVIGQQVSVAGAATTLGKLVTLATGVSPPTDPEELVHQGFPTPEQVAAAPLDQLGVPSRRRETVRGLAEAVASGRIDLSGAADRDETTRRLVELPGIGPWTAGYIAMRALDDPDGWPVGDLVLRQSLGVDQRELERRAERWRPWRAYAALLLWNTAGPPATRRERTHPKPQRKSTMITACSYDTPVGELTVLADDVDGSMAVVAAGFCPADELAERLPGVGPADVTVADGLGPLDDPIRRYLAGDVTAADEIPVRQAGTDLQQEVWSGLRAIPAGETRTYSQLASTTSKPNAVRAVGSACGRNLIAPFVPCHRALRSDGSLGGYYYGLDVKRWLLDHEAEAADQTRVGARS